MRTAPASMRFAGSQLGDERHVCALFNTEEEEYRTLIPFIKRAGEKL